MKIFKIVILSVLGVGVLAGSFVAGYLWMHPAPILNQYVINLKDEAGKTVEFQYGAIPSLTNPDYYTNVRGQLIVAKTNFIDADLAAMKLTVYKQGVAVLEVPIAAKGRIGSWFQTPSGLYKAQDKQKNHRSSFEPVYMKWNIPFQGNYFIHGWPTYVKTGKPVTSDASAGCIRLSDADAKKVYDLADVGMPILVHENDVVNDSWSYNVPLPTMSGEAYLAADLSNNFVFLERNQNFSYPLSGFAKLFDALVVSEYMNFDTPIEITSSMTASTSVPRLTPGKKYTPYDLIFPLVLEDSNEAALALATPLGQKYFVNLLNKKAAALGMDGTAIVDSTGVSMSNVTTAKDIFALAKALFSYRHFILDMTRDPESAMNYGQIAFSNLQTNTMFVNDEGYEGGFVTPHAVMAIYKVNIRGAFRHLVFISFNTTDPKGDVAAMKQYVTNTYK